MPCAAWESNPPFSSLRILHQDLLQPGKRRIVQIVRAVVFECRQLDENGLHRRIIRNLRIYAIYV